MMPFGSSKLFLISLALLGPGADLSATDHLATAPRLDRPAHRRRPVSLVLRDHWLFVANRNSGTVSVIDTARREVVDEPRIGRGLSDLEATGDGRLLLATDEPEARLLVLRRDGRRLEVLQRLSVSPSPVTVEVDAGSTTASVASLWARRIHLFRIVAARLEPAFEVDLPFAPRAQWLSNDGNHLVVADSFGGRLAVIDVHAGAISSLWSFAGNNVRGLACSEDGRRLLLTHQVLNRSGRTTRETVFWGGVIKNVVRSIPLIKLLHQSVEDPTREEPIANPDLYPLGKPGRGAADPGEILVAGDGRMVIALSGVGEVAFQSAPGEPFKRCQVGRRPLALAADANGRTVYVANMLDDSISVLDLTGVAAGVTETIALGPQPEPSLADRGEGLFFDASLSLDGWYSCHSCHSDGHTNGLLNDNFSDESFGTPKRILSLLGTSETGPWAWRGSQVSLEDQIRKSIEVTMQGEDPERATIEILQALAAYLRTLVPPPSVVEARGELDRAAIARGESVFTERKCGNCHGAPTYTSVGIHDVGLRDERGLEEFNPPSLRGLGQRDAYFHDNRAVDLIEVFRTHNHPDSSEIPDGELRDLLCFLRSL